MRLKEIKPGMVIHCKNDEEKKALLEEAERLGYVWYETRMKPTENMDVGNTIHFYDAGATGFSKKYKHITHSGKIGGNVTEFSDLILPELTAEEVWNGLGDVEDDEIYDYFPCGFETRYELILRADWKDLVAIVEKHIADHEKKEPEIETVDICRIIEIQPDGKKRCVHEEDISDGELMYSGDAVENCRYILKNYCKEHDGEFIAVHEVVSRVKAVE